jgi:hypothetical protein
MKWSLLAVVLLVGCASAAQQPNSDHIMCIEFSSLTRGYQEYVLFTSDSMKYTRTQAGHTKISKARELKKSEWKDLLKVAQKINLKEIPELKSPTMKRAHDGARHSTITIITDSNQTYIHTFDDENPHEKLKALMNVIAEKRGKQ